MTHWATDNRRRALRLSSGLLVFEVLFYGVLAVFSDVTKELFPFWAVVSANTLAALAWARTSGTVIPRSGARSATRRSGPLRCIASA